VDASDEKDEKLQNDEDPTAAAELHDASLYDCNGHF
jgi:hypothetical protein